MSLHDRIKEGRKKKGITQEQLGELIGVAKTTIAGYEKNREPTAALLGEIADALEVDANFLLQDEMNAKGGFLLHLQYNEMEHIKKYHNLDEYGKDAVDTLTEKELYRIKQQAIEYHITSNGTEAVRELPLYYMPASAGSGNYLDTTDYEMIRVVDISPASKADFAIRIDGDSMEPQFTTGDIVLVKEQDYVEKGELGIFILNGDSLFKQLGDGCLVSLNPKYEPRQIGEGDSIYCRGKVLGAVKIAE